MAAWGVLTTKKKMDVKRKGFISGFVLGVLAVFLFIAGLVLWQMGSDTYHGSNIVTTGWMKLLPLSPSIVYESNGSYETVFMNAAGTSINITSVSLNEELDGVKCLNVEVDGSDLSSASVLVKAGDCFEVTSVCETKSVDDPFDLSITIEYDQLMGGIITSHTETGRIRGPVEP